MKEINGFELTLGNRHYLFNGSETPFNNLSSSNIAQDKYCAHQILEMAGIPVPRAVSININEFRQNKTEQIIADLRFPLVLKPLLYGAQGRDVLCNIQTFEELHEALAQYFAFYNYLLIEEFHGKLRSYRVLVFRRKVIGVVLRHAASVVGDGQHTIEQLVALTNIERKKINDFLGPIVLDREGQIKLKELGITADYIPSVGERVVLCYTSNASRGGTYKSLGNQICKENRKLMIKVASVLNLGLAGIDVECADINLPIEQSNGVIIEVNCRPSVRIHECPMSGQAHLVTKRILRYLIFRHPLFYLHALYSNKPTAFYARGFIAISVLAFIFLLFFGGPPNID